jgi:hypothetical protein
MSKKGCPTCKYDDYNSGKNCLYSKICGENFKYWKKIACEHPYKLVTQYKNKEAYCNKCKTLIR